MSTQKENIVLPRQAEAIGTITRFSELDAAAITDHLKLAEALGGMSAALSAVALNYGEAHPVSGTETNIGLWTEIGDEPDRHKFTVTAQDPYGLGGAKIWRSAIVGGTERYHRHVNIPTEKILKQFRDADPSTLVQGWPSGRPYWEDIYAVSIATDQGVTDRQEYWPFYLPVADSRPDDHPTTPTEDALSYTRILQNLSCTLLEIVR